MELMVYLSLMALVMPLNTLLLKTITSKTYRYIKDLEQAVDITCSLMTLRNDLKKASLEGFQAVKRLPTELSFIVNNRYYRWHVKNGKLLRSCVRGDAPNYKEQSCSLIMASLSNIDFEYVTLHNELKGINVRLSCGLLEQLLFIALENCS